jgi:hypothetical protein
VSSRGPIHAALVSSSSHELPNATKSLAGKSLVASALSTEPPIPCDIRQPPA